MCSRHYLGTWNPSLNTADNDCPHGAFIIEGTRQTHNKETSKNYENFFLSDLKGALLFLGLIAPEFFRTVFFNLLLLLSGFQVILSGSLLPHQDNP